MQHLNKGDLLHCLITRFSSKSRYCVLVDFDIDYQGQIIKLEILPITTKLDQKDLCICYDCNDNCTKIELFKEDSTKSFKFVSYLYLRKYQIFYTDCDCVDNFNNISKYKVTEKLRNKLKKFNIYV